MAIAGLWRQRPPRIVPARMEQKPREESEEPSPADRCVLIPPALHRWLVKEQAAVARRGYRRGQPACVHAEPVFATVPRPACFDTVTSLYCLSCGKRPLAPPAY